MNTRMPNTAGRSPFPIGNTSSKAIKFHCYVSLPACNMDTGPEQKPWALEKVTPKFFNYGHFLVSMLIHGGK